MPRPKQPGAPEPKRRSRKGCWPCKTRKIKCSEERPSCSSCVKNGDSCDYNLRLNWEGRRVKQSATFSYGIIDPSQPSEPSIAQEGDKLLVSSDGAAQTSGTSSTIDKTKPDGSQFKQLFFVDNSPSSFRRTSSSTSLQNRKRQSVVDEGPSESETKAAQPEAPKARVSAVDKTVRRRLAHSQGSTPKGTPRQTSRRRSSVAERKKTNETPMNFGDLDAPAPALFPSLERSSCPSPPILGLSEWSPLAESPWVSGVASPYSDDSMYDFSLQGHGAMDSPDAQFSVDSDFSDYPAWDNLNLAKAIDNALQSSLAGLEAGQFYGYDLGMADADMGKNDDANALSKVRPELADAAPSIGDAGNAGSSNECKFGAQYISSTRTEEKYYDKPVPVVIPWNLEPLPDKLRDNHMNLLYFHHFIHHTAKTFVTYHGADSNPFSTILPRMAVQDNVLMSLVLAYSASHRAHILQTKVPEMRMAQWAQDIFPVLRTTLGETDQPASNTTLAITMLLSSLEIVSPGAFGYGIAWRKHCGLARDLVRKRMASLKAQGVDRQDDEESWFLWSWFAYLDVLGRLSGGCNVGTMCPTWLCDLTTIEGDALDEVDCVMGCTMKCAHLLGHAADLMHRCEKERLGPNREVLHGWVPRPRTVEAAKSLERELLKSLEQSAKPCRHVHGSNIQLRDLSEMAATNEAFHWAGIAHLRRRVLGYASSDEASASMPLQRIMHCIENVRWGGTAEQALLFPMFTVGCEMTDEAQRATILARFKSAEKNGMAQVRRARELMERCWAEGKPWEALVGDEFIG